MNYHVARNGQQLGIVSDTDLNSMFLCGQVIESDLCWTQGMPDWQPVGSVFAVKPEAVNTEVVKTVAPVEMNPVAPMEINPYAAPRADVSRRIISRSAPVELANRYTRLAAKIVDVIIIAAVGGILAAVVIPNVGPKTGDLPVTGIPYLVVGMGLFLALLIYNLYLLSTQGQTMGKKLLNIRIVSHEDNGRAGFLKAVFLRIFCNTLICAIPFIGNLYSLVDICCIFRSDNRTLHDVISGTQVVKA